MIEKSEIVEKFREKRSIYEAFTERVENLIKEIVKGNQIRYHLVESRTKTVESFSEKIFRPGKYYKNPFSDVPDITGIRIIVYYIDDVKTMDSILENEFSILEKEMSHQVEEYEANKFGYLSAHYVVKLKSNRCDLSEWKGYKNLHAEIQVRTVLQHAWAAISHAMQYKRESDVPQQLKRRLFRLAGLFELADEEFRAIRDSHNDIKDAAQIAIESGDETVAINKTTLNQLFEKWPEIFKIRSLMIEAGFEPPREDLDERGNDSIGNIVDLCKILNINDIGEFKKNFCFDYGKYFKKLIDESDTGWRFSDNFAVLIVIVRANIDRLTAKMLVEMADWDGEIAELVINVARNDANK